MGRPRKEPQSEMDKLAAKIGDDGKDIVAELEGLDVPELNKRIAQSSHAIAETKFKLEEENVDYIEAKATTKLLSSGFREVKKRQSAIIAVALKLREDKGAV